MGYYFNADKLRAVREAHGLTVSELAQAAQCSQPQMTRLLRGQRCISAVVLANLLTALGVTATELDVDYDHAVGTTRSQWW